MVIDKKMFVIIGAMFIVMILVILLVRSNTPEFNPENDPYVQKLKAQNKELETQLTRLKKNYVDIGLLDSVQTQNMDSLIVIATRKVTSIRQEALTYRTALEEMKTREWKRLSESQKNKEIEEALNFLQNNENKN